MCISAAQLPSRSMFPLSARCQPTWGPGGLASSPPTAPTPIKLQKECGCWRLGRGWRRRGEGGKKTLPGYWLSDICWYVDLVGERYFIWDLYWLRCSISLFLSSAAGMEQSMLETVVPKASYSSVVKVVRGKRKGQVSSVVGLLL